MKDIIRQAVADAAEYLFVTVGNGAPEIMVAFPEDLLRTAFECREMSRTSLRRDQLADFVANPLGVGSQESEMMDDLLTLSRPIIIPTVTISHAAFGDDVMVVGKPRIDSVLIVGPGGKVVHGGGLIGRTVMVELTPGVDGKVTAREAAPKAVVPARDFNKDVELPAPSDPKWSVAVTASFDGAEGEGRVWLSTREEDEPMIAIEGRQNAATLAGMLIDWVQPDALVVQRALLERLARVGGYGNVQNDEAREAINALTDLLK